MNGWILYIWDLVQGLSSSSRILALEPSTLVKGVTVLQGRTGNVGMPCVCDLLLAWHGRHSSGSDHGARLTHCHRCTVGADRARRVCSNDGSKRDQGRVRGSGTS